jgi:hypothetical protein
MTFSDCLYRIKIMMIAFNNISLTSLLLQLRRHRGRDRMVVGFTTTYAISTYHH